MEEKRDWKYHRRSMILNHEIKRFTKTFRENFVTLIVSALGLVAALTWNDAIRAWIDTLFPEKTVAYRFYVAFMVTIISITLTYFISKLKTSSNS
jgi:hypothetical protein